MLLGWVQPLLRQAERGPQEGLVPSAARTALATGPLSDAPLLQ